MHRTTVKVVRTYLFCFIMIRYCIPVTRHEAAVLSFIMLQKYRQLNGELYALVAKVLKKGPLLPASPKTLPLG